MTLVPGIVDYVTIFANKLTDLSKKHEPFRLEEITTRYVLRFDCINVWKFETHASSV